MSLQSPRQVMIAFWIAMGIPAQAVIGHVSGCLAVLLIGGCAVGPSPMAAKSPSDSVPTLIDLRPLLRSEYGGGKRYIHYPSLGAPASVTPYIRVLSETGRVEGSLRHFQPQSIPEYLDLHSDRPRRSRAPWPMSRYRNAAGFFIEFEPSLVEWPSHIESGVPHTSAGRLLAFDRAGILFTRGSARRSVWLVGRESVTVDGKHYSNCLRLGSATHLRFGWWATVRIEEAAWLAEGVGIVRRIQAIRGSALLLFPFASSYVFDLQDETPPRDDPSLVDRGTSVELLTHWKRLAIHLERVFPRPQVGGLVVEADLKSSTSEQASCPPR